MTTKMDRRSVMWTLLVHVLLISHGAQCSEPEEGSSLGAAVLDLPWHDELCCDSPPVHVGTEKTGAHRAYTNQSESNLPLRPLCSFRSSTNESRPHQPAGGRCLDIRCRIDENWEFLTCELQSGDPAGAGLMEISLQRLLSQTDTDSSDKPVVCEAKDSFMCSVALGSTTSFVAMVTVSISDAVASPVLLKVPQTPIKPSPPFNLSHIQTIEAELIVTWEDDSELDRGLLRYEVRHASNPTRPTWQVVSARGEPRLSLDLKPELNYTIQVRCSGLDEPPLWSDWSEPHHIYLDNFSYIPETVVARPGENVTVYCVFNDHSVNASTAMWSLNFQKPLSRSQYHPVNQWVSQITMRPSATRMYDLLQCTQNWSIPYSQVYVEGASIDIHCETNGDINAMECSWKSTQRTEPKFQSRWADLACDVMEEREKAGEWVGEWGPVCQPGSSVHKCTIRPLRMNCYKLWLEVPSPLGPIRSKPVYLSPRDHVKPHSPTNVRAVSRSNGVLAVTWTPPRLPVGGLQCQFRYHSPSTVTVQPEWKVQGTVRVPGAEASGLDMCQVYVVQVRCSPTSGTGYWSDWSESVYSAPQNSGAPAHGPDFWRILQENPYRNQTNVTLLFKQHPLISEQSYCVDGFVVQRQFLNGSVMTNRIKRKLSYSFYWNQEVQTVTVKAYNSLGNSTSNFNMTLDTQPKRRCLRSFHVLVINSTYVSLSWTLLDNNSVPLFMVVQWFPRRQQDSEHHKVPSRDTWARLHPTKQPDNVRVDSFAPEEYDFYLYPVFADGEGEPVIARAARGDPAAYMMLMIISFLSIVLLVTLVLSQNQMKKFVWKDVPNPNKCSWAKGLDLKKADAFDQLFGPQDGLPAWPLLLPPENLSTVVIVDKSDLSALVQPLTPDPTAALTMSNLSEFDPEVDQAQTVEGEEVLLGAPPLTLNAERTTSAPRTSELLPGAIDSSAQSSVTYATVLLSGPRQEQSFKDGSGGSSSSSDKGNFSANTSDISGSFRASLWELDSCKGGEMDDPRRSCSYNSVEELSEEEDEEMRQEKDLYYLGMNCPAEESEDEGKQREEEEETKTEWLKSVGLNREDCSQPLLRPQDPVDPGQTLSLPPSCGFSLLYVPQFRTVSYARQLTSHSQEGQP